MENAKIAKWEYPLPLGLFSWIYKDTTEILLVRVAALSAINEQLGS